jgi:HK97 gp10 family phage protein
MSSAPPLKTLVRVEGLAELEKKLNEFGPTLAKKGVRYAVSRGAAVIRNQAKENAPEKTGNLKRAIFMKYAREFSTPWTISYIVGVRRGSKKGKGRKSAFYWSFLEFGTKRIEKREFIQKAFAARQKDAIEKIKDGLAKKIMQYAEKRR